MTRPASMLLTATLAALAACGPAAGRVGPPPEHALRAVSLVTASGAKQRVALRGQLLPVGVERLPFRFEGEGRLALERRERLLLVNNLVVGVDLTGADVPEALRWLPRVKRLELVVWRDAARLDPRVVDALTRLESHRPVLVLAEALTAPAPLDLRRLAPLCPVLHGLVLEGDVSAAGLRALSGCAGLRALAVRGALPAGGLAALGRLRQLVFLELAGALRAFGPGPEGLVPLGALPGLAALDLADNGLTDGELAPLGALRGLHWLRLAGNPVTGHTLGALGALPRLRYLDLSRTGVTSAGLARIAGLGQLLWLGLEGVPVTARGLLAYHRARPKVVLLDGAGGPLPLAVPPPDKVRSGPRALDGMPGLGRAGVALGHTGGPLGLAPCDQYLALMRCYVGTLSQAGAGTGLRALRNIEQTFRRQLATGGAAGRTSLSQTCTRMIGYLRQSLARLPAARRCLGRVP